MLHRVVRGTLVALGVPDGRLKALVDVECAAYLTALQLKSLSNWGVGAELATVGHHSYVPGVVDAALIFDAFQRPAFLSEVHHASPRAPDARRLSFLEAPEARFGAVGPGVVGAALCGNQPLVWGVPTKLQNSLSRSHRSRFG